MAKVHLLSLGCPKNRVDSERLLRRLSEAGWGYAADPETADVLMVNTCGFIEEAKRESIEEILKVAQLKDRGAGKKLLVFGCLAQRYGDELKNEVPEIDALWGVGADEEIAAYCERMAVGRTGTHGFADAFTDDAYAYLKIAEGCDRGCSYCAIPGIRGRFISRRRDEILHEAGSLVAAGKKELILIAQDITSYGRDGGDCDLGSLVRDICSVPGDFWVRLLYLYPTAVDDALLDSMADEDKVCKYIDMPLQHSVRRILGLMGRGGSRSFFEKRIRRIRRVIPDVTLRTTFIVGFPSETAADFRDLEAFVRDMEFDRLGVFAYSREEGTPAALIKGQVPKRVKTARYERIMEVQSAISLKKNRALVGRRLQALVDEQDAGVAIARLQSHAPDIDGVVFIESPDLKKGDFVPVEITEAYDYDLKARVVR